jgi:hypothetical protein
MSTNALSKKFIDSSLVKEEMNFEVTYFISLDQLIFVACHWKKRKEHMIAFHKRLLVCDPSLGPEFLHKVEIHYNMNPKLEMLSKKLQMYVSACLP